MTVNEELKQLKDAVGDLTSHVVAALDMLDAGLAAAADGQAGADTLSTLHSQIQRNKSHIADVRTRISKLDQDEKDQIYLLRRILEAEVLRTIDWPDATQLEHIRGLTEEVVSCLQRHNVDAALDAARLFSFTLFDLSPLELLVRETKRYWDLAAVYRSNAFGANTSSGDAMKAYYAEFLDDLERYDRDGLIELNSRQRRRVPQQISPI